MTETKKLLIILLDGDHPCIIHPGEGNVLHTTRRMTATSAHKRSSELRSDRPGASHQSDSTLIMPSHHGTIRTTLKRLSDCFKSPNLFKNSKLLSIASGKLPPFYTVTSYSPLNEVMAVLAVSTPKLAVARTCAKASSLIFEARPVAITPAALAR